MKHPLENYRVIANTNFISGIEDKFYIIRYSELCHNGGEFEVTRERANNRLKIAGIDIWGEGFIVYETLGGYFLFEYNKLEVEARSEIDNFMMLHLDEKEQKVFLKNIIAELQVLQNEITEFSLEPKFEECKSILLEKITVFSKSLQSIYHLKSQHTNNSIKKIKWLGSNKQLGTLFFDLWKGQKGTSKNPNGFKPIIEADTKEQLMEFIFNNFISKKEEPLSLSSLSDQLNESESKNDQSANENRIELSC